MAVPRKILDLVSLDAGQKVELTVENGRLIIEPAKKRRYTLRQLLSRCRANDLAPPLKDRQWLDGGPAGRELL